MRLVCCSPAPHVALLASRWRFPGEALSRESLTQDSRSAVKARSFDPSVDHSAKGVAPLAKLAWRPREWTTRERSGGAYALRPHATSCGELKARGTRAARRPPRSTHRTMTALSG